jgi:hypothetical protein
VKRISLRRVIVLCAIAVPLALIAAVGPSGVFAANGGDGGSESVSCTKSGYTIHATTVLSNYCLSNWTGFYANNPFLGGGLPYCRQNFYTAEVHYAPPSGSPDIVRFRANYCADGTWHFSNTSASNEPRYSVEYIGDAGVTYQMIQYKTP